VNICEGPSATRAENYSTQEAVRLSAVKKTHRKTHTADC